MRMPYCSPDSRPSDTFIENWGWNCIHQNLEEVQRALKFFLRLFDFRYIPRNAAQTYDLTGSDPEWAL